ncbi:MAG: BrnT family toxin [Thermodesulfobacteriota bacterium]|nr:BrnT family toxin [Thermodesulfobacteriota bacterium]
MRFEWNKDKELSNISKHGVTFEQASYVFADRFALSLYDDAHSTNEDRWIMLGHSLNEMLLLVVHTFRLEDDLEYARIISARKATKSEKKIYRQRCP